MSNLINFLYMDYAPLAPVTGKTRKVNKKRIFTGSIRISKGLYRTEKEQDKFIKEAWKEKLP